MFDITTFFVNGKGDRSQAKERIFCCLQKTQTEEMTKVKDEKIKDNYLGILFTMMLCLWLLLSFKRWLKSRERKRACISVCVLSWVEPVTVNLNEIKSSSYTWWFVALTLTILLAKVFSAIFFSTIFMRMTSFTP